ncbi:PREDICTED: uncharacterized protein LOC105312329 [Amphimedon queenslandica]|uniref:hydroxymethylglutaryl-CoA reductase (NADPH) n=1 Tax=Amphimedon queenslandica TaxID=400682 RepID=A0A1X7V4Z4_AMPQE|nr:PREDICTED: uncharacterized protein LOC105312329 [Amphimedon queenslandica]|eukprot:XP_019850653.1 PREDICTED: uncharacterized protein LOC105312329 [Amphimedon queenslandica]
MSARSVMEDKDQYGHPRIPHRGHYDPKKCNQRRQWAEKFTSSSLSSLGEWWSKEGEDDSRSCLKLKGNIENAIGLAKVPIGLVGPVLIKGVDVSGYVICPFATTEGALVASATRGAALLTRSGGVRTKVIEQVMIRTPGFAMESMEDAEFLYSWALINKPGLQKQVKLFSQFANLFDLRAQRFGRNVMLIFRYSTNDAAGQNMVTSATWHSCRWLIKMFESENPSIKIKKFFIETTLSGDKKVAWVNFYSSRGVHVIAEAWIPEPVLKDTFKITVEDLLHIYHLMVKASARIGSIGFSVNVANALAAIFTATGQDIACVVESTSADLILEPLPDGGIYASMVLPSLIIGTIGGGTGLATQKECLQMIGCFGHGKVGRFAEIIAAVCLGLDLSTMAAIGNGTFALSHEKLGRNKPDHGLKSCHINENFFAKVVKDLGSLVSWSEFNVNTGNSIISELTKSEMKKKVGHFGYKLQYVDRQEDEKELKIVLKSKPIDTETCNVINKMAANCGFALASNHEKYKKKTGFNNCHVREVRLAALDDPILKMLSPKVYYTIDNKEKDIYVIVMEFLQKDTNITHLNSADDISDWKIADIKVVLRDLAKLHSHFYTQRKEWLESTSWLERSGLKEMTSLMPLWLSLLDHAGSEFPSIWTPKRVELLKLVIENIPHFWSKYSTAPKTLIHNDCNPRNVCIKNPVGGVGTLIESTSDTFPYSDARTACIYDWELARVDIPQHDVAEFLAFTLPVETDMGTRLELIEFYRKHFELYGGVDYPVNRFIDDYNIAVLDYAINRLPYYTMAHTYKDYRFLPRVIESHFVYIFHALEPVITGRARL